MRTLWVSSDKVMGIIQSLEPSASNPTSVQVLGRTYEIESAQAALALSDGTLVLAGGDSLVRTDGETIPLDQGELVLS